MERTSKEAERVHSKDEAVTTPSFAALRRRAQERIWLASARVAWKRADPIVEAPPARDFGKMADAALDRADG